MKAIVNVNKKSAYSKYNGLTFDVIDVMSTIISLNIDNRTVDFSHKELFIVDINNELQREYDNYNWGSKTYLNQLKLYCAFNDIVYINPKYNCPA